MTRGPRVNDMIRKSPIRLIDENNEMIGVVETPDALNRAREAGLDLVEVHADSDPPVCRITDYGKLRYEQSKKEKANKAKSKQAELKEVRLGRSMKIDPHDISIRMNQARKFLLEGHKVQIVQNFRGREMIHKHKGFERLNALAEGMEDIAKVEMPPRLNGRRMLMILAPDKPKVEQIKRREAQEKAEAEKNDPKAAKKAAKAEAEAAAAAADAPADAEPQVEEAPAEETATAGD